MIKVAFFADILSKDFDGASRTMFQIISRIDSSKYSFNYITGHDVMESSDIPQSNRYETSSVSVPFQKRYKMAIPGLENQKLKRKMKMINPDIIHIATPSLLGQWAVKYANKNGIPVITIFHTYFSSYLQYYFKNAKWLVSPIVKYLNKVQRNFYNACNVVLVPSLSMKEELIKIGVDTDKITIWERGINKGLFNPQNKDVDYIQNLVGNRRKNILFVSRLVWEKNLEDLISLYKLVSEKNLPYNFIVAGSGHAEKKVKEEMPSATFTGNLTHKELSKLYASVDILFFPSISETFGNVVLEGLASGTPAIVANKGGTKDMIQDGYNGYICKNGDINEYLLKITEILEDDNSLRSLSDNAYDSSKKFNWNDLTIRYFNLLEQYALKS